MNQALEDFLYQLETMNTNDLTNHALDDVWLSELDDEELIALIHEMVKRMPAEENIFDPDEEWEEEEDEYDYE